MAYLEWKDVFSVNIREIDNQHKMLIGMINELHEAMCVGKSKAVMSNLLEEMIKYAASHFATEEKYMKEYHFPGYEEHKTEHDNFAGKVMDFQEKYRKGSLSLSLEVMDFLMKWLVQHIQGTDKKYAPYLNMRGIK